MTGPRRLSQAISEGDGISLIVAVAGPEEAREAEAGGAEALLADDNVDAIRAASSLPILTAAGSAGDARIVRPGDADVELGDSVEVVVQVGIEPLECLLELFLPPHLHHDLPAGKLAIADVGAVTQEQLTELERAGVDAVLVRELP